MTTVNDASNELRKKLIIMVGLPRSGKSTWAKRSGNPVVNPDSIRLALHGSRFVPLAEPFVWAISVVMVRALFLAGHNTVIVDACHGTKKRRDFWINHFGYEFKVEFACLLTSADTCIQRARISRDFDIIPVIERMEREQDFRVTYGTPSLHLWTVVDYNEECL